MYISRKLVSSTATTAAALLLLISVPAFAEHGSSSGSGDSVASPTTSSDSLGATTTEQHSGRLASRSSDTTPKTEVENETEMKTAEVEDGNSDTEVHTRGAKILADAKKSHKTEKTADAKKKSCETHKQGIENKFTHISVNSEKIQAKIDGILAKAQDFKTSKNVELANYTELLSAATTAQANSVASIAALKAMQPTLDCNNTSVASDIAMFKASSEQTRDNLKTYRTAVKALLIALSDVKTPATTTGGN